MAAEPKIDPEFQDISPATLAVPSMSGWYQTNVILVYERWVQWAVAAGFQMIAQSVDPDTGENTYLMYKVDLQSHIVLQDFLQDFTNAYNEGRSNNDKRYEDILEGMQDVLDKQQTEVCEFRDDKVDNATGYITLMMTTLDALEGDFTSLSDDLDSYDTGERESELSALKNQWSTAADDLKTDYDNSTSGLDIASLISEVDDAIDDLDSAVTKFNTQYETLSATLLSDYNSHVTTATAFLTDLGTTETARINEAWDNRKSANNQLLVDRGFYSSAIVTQMEAQVERERSEDLAKHNDLINREKFENQHRLYEQQFRMRIQALEVPLRAIQAAAQVVSARLQHGDWASKIRHQVMGVTIQANLQLLSVRERYYRYLLESIDWQDNRRRDLWTKRMETRMRQFELRHRICMKDFELLRYELDERNNLALGLFGFVERRTDGYPDLGAMAQLAASLGETGASTWTGP